MARLLRAVIFITFIFSAKSASAACHTVTPSGSGSQTGADWNNAYAGLPGTLVRGDIYYLADGNYGNHLSSAPPRLEPSLSNFVRRRAMTTARALAGIPRRWDQVRLIGLRLVQVRLSMSEVATG